MFTIYDSQGNRWGLDYDSLVEVLPDLKILCEDTTSSSVVEALIKPKGVFYTLYNDGYEMTLTEIKYYEEGGGR